MIDPEPDASALARAASEEAHRLLGLASECGATIRLLGSVGIAEHCRRFGYLFTQLHRPFYDVDFGMLRCDDAKADALLIERGYSVDKGLVFATEGRRRIYTKKECGECLTIDVFLDELDFCHRIDLRGRLLPGYTTLPLADLWLSKMQIAFISQRDLLDVTIMMMEHGVSNSESREAIDIAHIAGRLAGDWGFYHSVDLNLDRLTRFVAETPWMLREWRSDVNEKMSRIRGEIVRHPKTLAWKTRSVIGERMRWYAPVDDREPVF